LGPELGYVVADTRTDNWSWYEFAGAQAIIDPDFDGIPVGVEGWQAGITGVQGNYQMEVGPDGQLYWSPFVEAGIQKLCPTTGSCTWRLYSSYVVGGQTVTSTAGTRPVELIPYYGSGYIPPYSVWRLKVWRPAANNQWIAQGCDGPSNDQCHDITIGGINLGPPQSMWFVGAWIEANCPTCAMGRIVASYNSFCCPSWPDWQPYCYDTRYIFVNIGQRVSVVGPCVASTTWSVGTR